MMELCYVSSDVNNASLQRRMTLSVRRTTSVFLVSAFFFLFFFALKMGSQQPDRPIHAPHRLSAVSPKMMPIFKDVCKGEGHPMEHSGIQQQDWRRADRLVGHSEVGN